MKKFLWEVVHCIVLTLENLDKPIITAVNIILLTFPKQALND